MKSAMILGYVEDKTVGETLDKILKSDQIASLQEAVEQHFSHRLFGFHLGSRTPKSPGGNALPFGKISREAKIAARGSRQGGLRSVAGFSPPRRKALAARNSSRWHSPPAAISARFSRP